jgi:hypothetical protein
LSIDHSADRASDRLLDRVEVECVRREQVLDGDASQHAEERRRGRVGVDVGGVAVEVLAVAVRGWSDRYRAPPSQAFGGTLRVAFRR